MASEQLNNEFSLLERKLTLLLNEYRDVKKNNLQLKEDYSKLQELLKNKDRQLADFQNQIKISKIAVGIEADKNDASELKEQLEEYINEIDKCIAHLSH